MSADLGITILMFYIHNKKIKAYEISYEYCILNKTTQYKGTDIEYIFIDQGVFSENFDIKLKIGDGLMRYFKSR